MKAERDTPKRRGGGDRRGANPGSGGSLRPGRRTAAETMHSTRPGKADSQAATQTAAGAGDGGDAVDQVPAGFAFGKSAAIGFHLPVVDEVLFAAG